MTSSFSCPLALYFLHSWTLVYLSIYTFISQFPMSNTPPLTLQIIKFNVMGIHLQQHYNQVNPKLSLSSRSIRLPLVLDLYYLLQPPYYHHNTLLPTFSNSGQHWWSLKGWQYLTSAILHAFTYLCTCSPNLFRQTYSHYISQYISTILHLHLSFLHTVVYFY